MGRAAAAFGLPLSFGSWSDDTGDSTRCTFFGLIQQGTSFACLVFQLPLSIQFSVHMRVHTHSQAQMDLQWNGDSKVVHQ